MLKVDVAVIGGGNSGVEAAIDLAGVVAHVTLVEFADELKAADGSETSVTPAPGFGLSQLELSLIHI